MIPLQGGWSLDLGPTNIEPHSAALILSAPDGDPSIFPLTLDDLDRLILDATALRHDLLERG
jgi:hypothetical protein